MDSDSMKDQVDQVKDQADEVAQDAQDSARGGWLHRLGQVGFAAQGIVWFVVGWIAMGLAIGSGSSEDSTTSGAIEEIGSTPLGAALLVVMVLGLLCYVVWQLVLAVVGHPDEHGSSDLARRIGSAAKGVVAAALAVTGVVVLMRGSSGSGNTEEQGAQTLLSQPGGQILLACVGGAVVAVGLWWIWTGATERFAKKLDPRVDRKVLLAGRVGHAARGFAFTVLGVLVALAALRSDPDQAGGTDTALVTILGWPAGPVLVGAIAVGLMLFGVFHVLAARHVVKD
ncbi:DUF1206 domain-containing protein [Georgenia sp. Z1344]|uniref:DUF1206 domain-containing protein n=1 Tax=Georgenia sp. Z1344 TaxID=3416706 RepID=UPI003CED7C07